ncbi:unnamed protein product [Mesocestoides corti]|uniref:BACK domain-containing protein n=1 Tax=Mesocestoides corti TaxID=53468 RepID=A0A0R3UIL1_MESCO|nr:unnamed protein product [Mesocestoides corti]
MNGELMSICVPVISGDFYGFTGLPMFPSSTDPEYLVALVKDIRLTGVSECSKLRAITTWFEAANPEDNANAFKDLVGAVELGRISSHNFVDICTSKCVMNLPVESKNYLVNAWKLATKSNVPRKIASSMKPAAGGEVLNDYIIAYDLPSDNSAYLSSSNFLKFQPHVNLNFKLKARRNCVLLSKWGCIFLIGGEDNDGRPSNMANLVEIRDGRVSELPSMASPRLRHCAAILGGKLLVFGGRANGSDLRSCGGGDLLEFSPETEVDDSALEEFSWKPLLRIAGLTCPRLLHMQGCMLIVKDE